MSGVRILVVEDEYIIALDIKARVEKLGYEVVGIASTGEEAVVKVSDTRPDLILMDIRLKGTMDGVQAARAIHQQSDIPIVYLTAYADHDTLQRVKSTRPFGYISKPFSERELHAAVEMALYRHEMEAKLKAQEQWLATTLESIGDGVITTDLQGRVSFLNSLAETMIGRPKETISGRSLDEVLHLEDDVTQTSVIVPVAAMLRQEGAANQSGEALLVGQTGQPTPVHWNASLIRDHKEAVAGVVLALRDITERKQHETALSEERNLIRTLIDNLPDYIYFKDIESRFIIANRAVAEIMGTAKTADLIGRTDFDFYPAEWAARYHADEQKIVETGEALFNRVEPLLNQTTNQERWLSSTKIPLRDSEGQVIGLVGIGRDITEQRETEAALQQERALLAERVEERTAALSAVNAELARAARLKDEFLANMSHELRTPLNTILGMVQALQEDIYGPCSDRQRQALESVEQSGRDLLALINDILDLSKIEAGKLLLDDQPILVRSVCRAGLQFIAQAAHEKGLSVSSNLDPQVETIRTDGQRLKQVLINLLTNAVKFTPAGGKVGLTVTAEPAQQRVAFTVWDTGIGISPEQMTSLFQPFVQLDGSLSRSFPGTGLGLALVYRLVDLMGGGVTVTSEPEAGSQFTIYLPAEVMVSSPAQDREAVTVSARQRVILLFDDNETFIRHTTDQLGTGGYQVIVARNSHEVLERARETHPDLILVDVRRSDAKEIDMVRQWRRDPTLQAVPLIVLTGLTTPERPAQFVAAGAADYLLKPVSTPVLLDIIGRHTG